ncbi:MAG: SurA N-terminal domain-containing protein [Bacteroidales bacterium]|nr:SurA N-terminal domain-containing protein [Bacteroidales bacterium]
MAAIQTLRKNSWILTIVIGLALLAFIVTGLDTSLFNSKQSNVIAEVDGQEYTYDEYYSIYELLENQQKGNSQDLSYAQKEQVHTSAWRSFLTGILFEHSYKNLGLSSYKENLNMQGISDDEFQDITVGDNTDPELQYYFRNPQTGQFDKEMLINVLSNLAAYKEQNPDFYESWIQFEKTLHENTLRKKYVSLISNGIYTTNLEAEELANTKNNQFNINFVQIPYETIADSTITVTDKEVADYYKTINYESRFKQEAGVSFEYVTFDIYPTEADVKATEDAVAAKAEDFKNSKNDVLFLNLNSDTKFNANYNKKGDLQPSLDTFAFAGQIGDITDVYFENNSYNIAKISDIRPCADSAKVRHILVNNDNAYELIDSLKKLVENGADFAALAREYSVDSVSAVNGGIIDWFKEGQMVKSFQDSSFFGEVGKLYIAPSNYGLHLIQILAQGPKSKRVQVQVFSKAVSYSQNTRSKVYQNAVKFVSENRTKEQFDAAVEADESLVKRVERNSEENQRVIVGIDDSRQVIRWVHQNKDKVNEVSEIFRCGDKFLVAVITSVNKEGAMPLEDVNELVSNELKHEKKKQIILDELKNADCSSLEALSQAKSVQIQESANASFASPSAPSIGMEPELIATLSTMEPGVLTSPIAGKRSVYVAKVTSKNETDLTTADKEKTMQQQRMSSVITNSIYRILEDKAEIEDNRINFN